LRKAAVLIGAFLLCSVTILAGGNDNFEKDFEQEFKILVGQDDNSGYLGVYLRDLQSGDVEELGLPAEKGVFLTEITEESPAEKSGLIKGDVIVEYQSMPVLSVKQFQRMVGDTPPGRKINIKLFREKKEMTLMAEIGSNDQEKHIIKRITVSGSAVVIAPA
jgi:S1-C subfamily serine protease